MTSDREVLALVPIADDPEIGHRVRSFERYDAAPDWALHHVIQHEAEHRAHIAWLRDTFPGR